MMKKILSGVLTVAALAGLGVYVWLHLAEALAVELVSTPALVLCAAAILAGTLSVGLIFFVSINKLTRCVGLVECTWLAVLTTAVNMLVPLQGGAWVRAVYLKRRHDFDYANFLATLYGYQILRVLVCALGAAAAILWMVFWEQRPGLTPLLTGVLFCLAVAVIACCLPRVSARGHWLVDRVASFTQGWHTLRARPKFLALMAALVALQLAGEILTFWAACAAIGTRLELADTVAVGTLSILATVLGLTPSGLGLYEATAAFISSAVGLDQVHSVMAAMVARLVLMGVLAVLTPLAVNRLSSGWKARPSVPEPEPEPVKTGG